MVETSPFESDDIRAAFPEYGVVVPSLGSGSFKVAYRVLCGAGEQVLKIVKQPLGEDGTLPERIRREVAGMKAISSERVVPVLTGPDSRDIVGRDGATHSHVFFTEPYLAGGTLEQCATSRNGLDFVAGVAADLLEGVRDLWSHGVVHRDIKPANIAIENGRAVLLDLGIAYFVDLTAVTDDFQASPRTDRYAAPEQLLPRSTATIDHRTDQFQVGIVLFELLTGSHPFDPTRAEGYWDRLTSGEIDEEALISAQAPADVSAFLRRLLQPSQHRRYRLPDQALQAARQAFG